MAQKVNWGAMDQEETIEHLKDGFELLTEENQMDLIVVWVAELGGPSNFVWFKEE